MNQPADIHPKPEPATSPAPPVSPPADIPFPFATLVENQRSRAHNATRRAQGIFAALIAVILLGIGYYVGLPLYLQWNESSRSVYEAEAGTLSSQLDRMDEARDRIWTALSEELKGIGTPRPSGVDVNLNDVRSLPDGTILVAVGRHGTVIRSTDAGNTWTPRRSGVDIDLFNLRVLPDSTTLVAVGEGGTVIRSTDAGNTWQSRPSGVNNSLYDLRVLPNSTTLIAVGRSGAVIRSTDAGNTWMPRPSGVDVDLYNLGILADGATLVAVGEDGTVIRSTDAGETWTFLPSVVDADLFNLGILPDSTTLVGVGESGTVIRSTDTDSTWMPRPSGVIADLYVPRVLPDGVTLIAVGSSGGIIRSTDAGMTWTPRPSGIDGNLFNFSVLPDSGILVAVGSDGAVIRSTDAGVTWTPRPSGQDITLRDIRVLPDGTTLIAIGFFGAIVIIDDRYADALAAIGPLSGSLGDNAYRSGIAGLPEYVRNHPVVGALLAELDGTIEGRADLETRLQSARASADEIRTGGFSLAQRRQDFEEFMRVCTADLSDEAEGVGTEHCTRAYVDLRQAESQTVWEILAERAPQAILLLFLLATLAALYRYNMRLAGFHAARADALHLYAMGRTHDPAILTEFSDALAADKVEFGKGNTPSEQAVEIAKAMVGRRG
ncbi:WD40/YVTN/BNR-like repeat-containing protein [Jannaschia sp. CCS1]|uniref:WD40/YVTN/BNR-like repeat-containing protein n=1 Tax=Jannaschia sp. (strain CCS1) TaxID=290400 RepID=UPI000053B919|nr:glycosyl hydrolase [Jannaschia sp. CCS1]ABD54920.1 glycosyl hydrolase BNR protein [Jannaschia sp. CCS1]